MTVEPVTTGTCAGCGKQRMPANRNDNKANSGTRIPAYLWAASVEADPFCSAECCRSFYGVRVAPGDFGSCPDCGKKHTTATSRPHGNRCGDCSHKFRRQRKSTIPGRCSGCAGDLDSFTDDCWSCRERKRYRDRCQDPVFIEKRRKRDTLRREAKRAAKKSSSARRLAAVEPPLTKSAPAMRRDFGCNQDRRPRSGIGGRDGRQTDSDRGAVSRDG